MTSDVGADGGTDSLTGEIRRLSQISNQTSLMTIDAVLRALPRDGNGYATAAAELRARHRWLRLPDALVLGTAVADDAVVLTGDRRLARLPDLVRVLSAAP